MNKTNRKDKPSQNKVNTNKWIEAFLKDVLEGYMRDYHFGYEPWTRWIRNEEQLIKKISQLPPIMCLCWDGYCSIALDVVKEYVKNNKYVPFYLDSDVKIHSFEELIFLAKEVANDNYEYLNEYCSLCGTVGLSLGFMAIRHLAVTTVWLHFMRNPVVYNALLIHLIAKLPANPEFMPLQEEALSKLSKYTRNIYRKNTQNDISIPIEEVKAYLWEAIEKAFSKCSAESLFLAAKVIESKNLNPKTATILKGHLDCLSDKKVDSICYIPNAAERDIINDKSKEWSNYTKEVSINNWLNIDSDLTFEDLIENDFNLEEQLENLEIVAQCLELVNNPEIITNRERQVFQLRFIEGFTQKGTGDELGIEQQTVYEIEKSLRSKLKSRLKNPFNP